MNKNDIILGLQKLANSIRTYETVHEASEVKIGDAVSISIPLTPSVAKEKFEELRNEALKSGVDMNDPEIVELINQVSAQVEASRNNYIDAKGNTITGAELTGDNRANEKDEI